ncbi:MULTISPECIES: host attachment protein [unclassified Rickettsia]|uniref:host attachment protein n=1 Tax=unclassified Rickettsia TaxID=114295 RepID=UPI00209CCB98|nr:host attachment protein [Rickettsia endosymbiont of Ceutorhynchus assimilis]
MKNGTQLKLIAVIDSLRMMLYEAQGIKITGKPEEILLMSEEHHHHREKSQSYYQNKSNPGSLFEPRTSLKDIEHKEAARSVAKNLDKIMQIPHKYKELIIVAEPQMLGCVRHELNNNLKKMITKEVAKDLVNHNAEAIERVVFS